MSDGRFDKLESKLDKLDSRLDGIDLTLAINTASLVEHVKRSNLLEARAEKSEARITNIETLKSKVEGGFKVIGIVGAALIGLAGVIQALKLFVSLF